MTEAHSPAPTIRRDGIGTARAPAATRCGLGVIEEPGPVARPDLRCWAVAHVPTGLALAFTLDAGKALELLEALRDLADWDTVTAAGLYGGEAATVLAEIHKAGALLPEDWQRWRFRAQLPAEVA